MPQFHIEPATVSLSIAAEPIRLVCHILRYGAEPNSYRIGGTVHCLVIGRNGELSWHKFLEP